MLSVVSVCVMDVASVPQDSVLSVVSFCVMDVASVHNILS